jgi:ubiquinone biosynthesis protein
VFEHGFYHADPHPGNFFVEPGGRIGLIDFGMVGTLDERTQEQLARLLLAVTRQDSERLVGAAVWWSESGMRDPQRSLDRHSVREPLGRPKARSAAPSRISASQSGRIRPR